MTHLQLLDTLPAGGHATGCLQSEAPTMSEAQGCLGCQARFAFRECSPDLALMCYVQARVHAAFVAAFLQEQEHVFDFLAAQAQARQDWQDAGVSG